MNSVVEPKKLISDIGEKGLLRDIVWPICRTDKVLLGVGDDAAVIAIPSGHNIVVSTDKIPEDLMALKIGLMSYWQYGRYLATVNISDVAAMGGVPIALLSTLALPKDFEVDNLRAFVEGFVAGGAEHGVPVVGGDLGGASAMCVSGTIIGHIEAGKELKRSTAQLGDIAFVSGIIGGFSTALAYFVVAKPQGFSLPAAHEEYLKSKLTMPQAKVATGRLLAQSGKCTSCQDITDGVGRTLHEIATASSVSFRLNWASLPIHPSTFLVAESLAIPVEKIVFGIGLDLELIGTLAPDMINHQAVASQEIYAIGIVKTNTETNSFERDGQIHPISPIGWQHFAGDIFETTRSAYRKQ